MNFTDQPAELLVQQLAQLPLQDLLNACQTHSWVAQVCSGSDLWIEKLRQDFLAQDFSCIRNPREYYFDLLRKRQDILEFITVTIDERLWRTEVIPNHDFNGSYQDFLKMQADQVNELTEQGIRDAETVMKLLAHDLIELHESDPELPRYLLGFYFDEDGVIKMVTQ